ncbi:hypothetical protein [Pseudomonas fulva]|uniref:hypothetical protein n=1 Tax=Pseudomonas fulva TaxID=47880 RepID=UPI0037FFF6A8
MTVRAAERESHFGGEPPEVGVALKVLATWGAVNDSGVQLIYKTPQKARQL